MAMGLRKETTHRTAVAIRPKSTFWKKRMNKTRMTQNCLDKVAADWQISRGGNKTVLEDEFYA